MSVDLLRLARAATGGGGGGGEANQSGVAAICAAYPQVQTGMRFAGTLEHFGSNTSANVTNITYSTVAPFTGLNNNVDVDGGHPMDAGRWADAVLLVYVPAASGLTAGVVYPLTCNGGGTNSTALWLINDGGQVAVRISIGQSNQVEWFQSAALTENRWYVIGGAWNESETDMALYLDGVLDTRITRTLLLANATADPDIGGNDNNVMSPGGGADSDIDGSGIIISELMVFSGTGGSPDPGPGLGPTFHADAYTAYIA